MRNLKRALSLALAAVMVLGMMVIGAGAVSIDDFSDKDKIVNTEAVTTMVSLGVINGKDDGSYDPTGIVTRAEMAKLIAVTLNGGKDPTLGAITAEFTDTKGHWAESYIAYVASLGIIDGRGDGTFGPNDQVTGAQAAKMILTMLGYRSDIEGFTGPTWAINVQTKGNDIDLFADMLINPDEGLTRDNTAQMLYNGVQSWMVEYRNLEGSYDGIVYPQPLNGTKANSTVLLEKFKVAKVEGVVQATSLIALNDGHGNHATTVEGKTRLTDIRYNGADVDANNNAWGDVTYPIAIDNEYLGYRVVIYVKGLNDLSPNASSMEVVGSYIVSDDNTAVTTTGRLAKTSDVKDALKGSGIAMGSNDPNTLTISADGTSWAGANGTQQMPGVTQTFIDNDADGTVDVLIRKNPALAKINTYNKSTEAMNISGIGAVDFVDVLNPEDVAQGDYVLVYNYDDVYVLAKAETVSGVVSTYNNNATTPALSTITIDDVKYGQGSGKNLAPDVMTLTDVAGTMQEMVDGTYTLYLDPNGYILGYVEDEGVIGNYAVITGVNSTGSTEGFYSAEVKVILADGSTGKYDVNLLASANKFGYTGSNSAKEKAMYTKVLTMKDTLVAYALDGSTITLIDPEFSTENYEFTNVSGDLGLKNSKASYVFGDGNLMADNKTVFFIKDKVGNYSVVNGLSNLRADAMVTTGTNQAIYYKLTMTAKALFATVNEEFTSNSNFAFVYGNYSSKTVGTDTVYTYPVVLEDGTITTLSSKTDKGVSKSAVHEYQVSGDYVTFDNQTGDIKNKLMVETVGNGTITVVDAETNALVGSYPVLSTAKIWNVEDVDATKADSVFTTSFQKYDKVALVFDTNDNIKTAYVYDRQDGEMTADARITLSAANGTLAADYATWTGVSANDELKVTVDYAAGQKVKVTSTVNGVKGTELDSTADPATISDNSAATIYKATGSENNTKVVVTVTVSQDGYASRTSTYTVNVSGVRAEKPTVTATGAGTGTFAGVTTGGNAVTEGTPLEATVVGRDATSTYAFTVAPAAGTKVESMKLNGEDYASGAKVAIPTTGEATYELVITVSESGKVTTTYTYTVNLVNLQAVAGTIKMDTGASDGVGIGGSAVELKAGETTTVTTTDYGASKTNVEINITAAGTGAVVSATLTGPDGLAKAYTLKSDASGDITLGAAAGTTTGETYTLTVVTGGNGYENVTTTYTILIKSAPDCH